MPESTLVSDPDKWLALKYSVLEKQLEIVFESFRENQVEPILIKGWAASLVYPVRWQRYSSDIDLAVAPEDYEKGLEIIKLHPNITLDLHRGLRHLDTQKWETLFTNSRLVNINTSRIRVLGEEDHLRVLAVHWLQDGGAYKHKLWDIFYAVEERSAAFDWDKFLAPVSQKRRFWLIYTIGLAHRYLNLNLDQIPFKDDAVKIPKWVLNSVEKEWANDEKLVPLDNSLGNFRQFYKQVFKRIPPNAVQATVDMEGDFNKYPRIYYQLGSMGLRILPSIKRLTRLIMKKNTT